LDADLSLKEQVLAKIKPIKGIVRVLDYSPLRKASRSSSGR
jgi:hypothetical protein